MKYTPYELDQMRKSIRRSHSNEDVEEILHTYMMNGTTAKESEDYAVKLGKEKAAAKAADRKALAAVQAACTHKFHGFDVKAYPYFNDISPGFQRCDKCHLTQKVEEPKIEATNKGVADTAALTTGQYGIVVNDYTTQTVKKRVGRCKLGHLFCRH